MKRVTDRIEDSLLKEGLIKKPVHTKKQNGLGDFDSFFDVMVDIRLEGKENISTEEVWEDMKMQVNYLLASLSKASRDYLKLQNKYRDLENDYLKLISSTNFKKG